MVASFGHLVWSTGGAARGCLKVLLDFGSVIGCCVAGHMSHSPIMVQMVHYLTVMNIAVWWSCSMLPKIAAGLRFRLARFPPSGLQISGILWGQLIGSVLQGHMSLSLIPNVWRRCWTWSLQRPERSRNTITCSLLVRR
jgi:hypothetical protein